MFPLSSPRPVSRRALLRRSALSFGTLGLSGLVSEQTRASAAVQNERPDPLVPPKPHFPARAKRVNFLFMHGGVSHIDSFDPKPRLDRDDGKPMPIKLEWAFSKTLGNLMRSPFDFSRHGQSGIPVSSLFPSVAKCVDDLCVIRSMVGDGVDHGEAMLQLHTGSFTFTRPSMGSWVFYGLGTENRNLPGFVTIKPTLWHGGAKNWGSAFLPGSFQGTPIGNAATNLDDLRKEPIEHLKNSTRTSDQQRYELEMLRDMNRLHRLDRQYDADLEARILSLELAFRMQMEAPEALSAESESEATKRLYGIDNETTRDFGWQCLIARRLAKRGVRFIQCSHSGFEEKWDHHNAVARRHHASAREVDKPIAGLLTDLKSRGLLDATLVIWAGEFGRAPFTDQSDGRDHNPYGFTIWMAGGGVKPGTIYGSTDEFGCHAEENRMHIHDLHATILHLLGLDHTRLAYRFDGRDFRLTDVHGVVAQWHSVISL